ncbi:MAG: oligosaccharide flippase family protein [Candidatus Omnitrophica bacterium]|nr:oligosaccharide flippase family protein [Candidatus Omnitrophota bacterium]
MKKLMKDYLTVFTGTGASRGISFVTTLLLARWMGAHQFGVFSLFFTVMMLAYQIPPIMDHVYVRYFKAGKKEERLDALRIAFFMKLVIAAGILILAFPLGKVLAVFVFGKPEMSVYLIAALAAGSFLAIYSSISVVFQAQERFHLYSVVNIIFYVTVLLSISVMLFTRVPLTPFSAASVYVVTAFLVGLFGLSFFHRRIRPLFPLHIPLAARMLHFGKWLVAETIIVILWQRLDVLFLARIIGYEELGVYSAAVRIAMMATVLTGAATAVVMPRGCRSLASTGSCRSYFRQSFAVAGLLTVAIGVLMVLTPLLVRIIFGAEYLACIPAARILLIDAVFILFYTPFSFLFYANGNTRMILVFTLTRLALTVVALSVLVPLYGPVGAALSITVSSFCVLMQVIWVSRKVMKDRGRYATCQ